MKKHFLLLAVAMLASTGCLSFRHMLVADRLYWDGPEGEENEAYNIGAKFNSQSELATLLRLDAPIGKFAERSWVLADVLVRLDLNGNGVGADWIVSGPRPLISEYVANLRKTYGEKKAMYDFSASRIDAKPTAFFEKED